jgi:NAD(P)-dependent dehydrogenase (short-subunit alcohol dehydrogenase family)
MAATYAADGIRCNVVCPGLIETPMSRRAQDDPAIRARLSELQPLTGAFGRPEDVAEAALYLATAPFVTGAVLTVDGGWTARSGDPPPRCGGRSPDRSGVAGSM